MGAGTASVVDGGQVKPVAEIIRESNRRARYYESGGLLFGAAYCVLLTYALVHTPCQEILGIVIAAGLCGSFFTATLIRFTAND